MNKSVKQNNKKLKFYFGLEIGNTLPREYDQGGDEKKIYTSSVFDYDSYKTLGVCELEVRAVREAKKLISVSYGDIVISLLTHNAAIVRENESFLLPPNYMKVTPKMGAEISREYFVYWFNEVPDARKQIEQGRQGSVISKLSIKFLREVKISFTKNSNSLGKLYFLTLKKNNLLHQQAQNQILLMKGLDQIDRRSE